MQVVVRAEEIFLSSPWIFQRGLHLRLTVTLKMTGAAPLVKSVRGVRAS